MAVQSLALPAYLKCHAFWELPSEQILAFKVRVLISMNFTRCDIHKKVGRIHKPW